MQYFNPFNPRDASKHHFAYLKNDFKFCGTVSIITTSFYSPPTSSHLHPLQEESCESNSHLEVDEDDNAEFSLKKVKTYQLTTTLPNTVNVSYAKN